MSCYGARKVWKQLRRERIYTARCTVACLMKQLKIEGIRRGKVVKTTIQDNKAVCPLDRVQRQFKADRPNQLWVSDFTYVSAWQGWLYVAFVIDVFARRIVGWRVSRSMTTDFVLDALEQALHARRFDRSGDLIHHSDRGSQYVSISYTERLAEAGIEPNAEPCKASPLIRRQKKPRPAGRQGGVSSVTRQGQAGAAVPVNVKSPIASVGLGLPVSVTSVTAAAVPVPSGSTDKTPPL